MGLFMVGKGLLALLMERSCRGEKVSYSLLKCWQIVQGGPGVDSRCEALLGTAQGASCGEYCHMWLHNCQRVQYIK